MAKLSIEERVSRGIAFLDSAVPGWRDHDDINDLDVRSGLDCPAALAYGGWFTATRLMPLRERDYAKHGFIVYPSTDDSHYMLSYETDAYKEYEALTAEWKRQLAL